MATWIPATASGNFDPSRMHAVEGGYEKDGTKLYVGRAALDGGVHIGKIAGNSCYIPLSGDETKVSSFEVLSIPLGASTRWVEGKDGVVPPNAVEGGHNEEGEKTYVARALNKGGLFGKDCLIVGEVVPSENVCYVAYDGKEKEFDKYEVLVCDGVLPSQAGPPPPSQQMGGGAPSSGYPSQQMTPSGYPGQQTPYNWVQTDGHSFNPQAMMALEGGYDNNGGKLYIGRAPLEGGLHVGKIVPSMGACFIPLFGDEHTVNNFEVLTVSPQVQARWVQSNNGQVPPNAVEGGYQDGNKTFVGRALHDGEVAPGEVVPSDGSFYISHNGSEVEFKNYECLLLDVLPPGAPGGSSAYNQGGQGGWQVPPASAPPPGLM